MTPVYLYQTIHTLDYRARMVEAHIGILNYWAERLFSHQYTPDTRKLTMQIAELLQSERRPRDLSVFVRLTLDPKGHKQLSTEGVSLYRGYALRSLTPEAAVIVYELPHPDAPTSAREAAAALACAEAECAGARIAIRCDSNGILRTADNASLFAVRGKHLFTSPNPWSVEHRLVQDAALRAGLQPTGEPVAYDHLNSYDELFFADHRGMTAISRCEGHPYLNILAGRIAREVEGFFASKV